jgi:AraC-type DNA-binding domain-containing proteins
MVRRKTEPPRGILKTPIAEGSRYRYERYYPSSDLAPFVEHFWLVEWDLRGQPPESAETLPHPSVHMIFEGEGRSRIRGPARAKFSTTLEGQGGVFAVKFTPGGFHPFARVPVSRFTDGIVRLADVFGGDGDALDSTVLAEIEDAGRIEAVERFLRGRAPEPDENVQRATEIVYAVAQDRAILNVNEIVRQFGLTKRTLQRLFAKYVGVSPKWVIQRYRLHEAAERIGQAERSAGYADLALELGYSDQAHFVRDFKAIVGVTPAVYARR